MGVESQTGQKESQTSKSRWLWGSLWTLVVCLGLWMWAPHISVPQDLSKFVSTQQKQAIHAFIRVNRDFGFSNAVLIGMKTAPKQSVFQPSVMRLNVQLTQKLARLQGIQSVLSLGSSLSIGKQGNALVVKKLLPTQMKSYTTRRAQITQRKTLQDPLLRGSLVSPNGRATFLLCSLKSVSPTWTAQARTQSIHELIQTVRAFQKKTKAVTFTLTGEPVVASIVQKSVLADVKAFLPPVFFLFVLFFLLAFPDKKRALATIATSLCVLSLSVVAILGHFGQWTESLIWLPFYCTALLLLWGIWVPLREVFSWTTVRSAFTSSIVLVSTLSLPLAASPIVYIQKLGWTLFFAGLALLAAIRFLPFFRNAPQPVAPFSPLDRIGTVRFRFRVGWFLSLVVSLGVLFLQPSLELSSLYPSGSMLAKGSTMERAFFGGDAPLIIRFKGELRDPVILRSIERLGRRLEAHPSISHPQSIAILIRRLNALLNQYGRIPTQRKQINALWMFLEGQPALKSLVRAEGKDGILQARVAFRTAAQQRSFLSFLSQVTRDLPTRYKAVSLDAQSPKRIQELLNARTDWIYEGVLLWFKRQFSHTMPSTIRKSLKPIISKYVNLVQRPDFEQTLEAHRLRMRLWNYLSDPDCDIELKKTEQIQVLRTLMVLNAQGHMLDAHRVQQAFKRAVRTFEGGKDKESVEYALRSVHHIIQQLSREQVTESLQRDIFNVLRRSRRWIQAFSKALRGASSTPRSDQQIRERMNQLRAELMELYNPNWIIRNAGPKALYVETTGVPSVTLPFAKESVRFVRNALIAFAIIGFLLFGLFFSRGLGMWKVGLGVSVTMLSLLGAMGWIGIPLHPLTGIIVILFGLIQTAALTFYIALPSAEIHTGWFKVALLMSVPCVPLLWVSVPLLAQLATLMFVGPWIVFGVLLFLLQWTSPQAR